jgi:isoquinoline 1-oxidoreductase beta subunit
MAAAAKKWDTQIEELHTENAHVINPSGAKFSYGELAASAAEIDLPKEVQLKDPKNFKIIGKSIRNVDAEGIVTGTALFGIDTNREGMVYARVLRAPGFGMNLLSVDATEARNINGVSDVVEFDNKVAVIANSTWAAIQGQNALRAEWSEALSMEDSKAHKKNLLALVNKKTSKPMELYGPIQTPARSRKEVAQLLNRNESEITVGLSRMGGGFGRRLRGDFVLEAAAIANKIRKPVQLIYTREDDMTAGVYRPACTYKFKAGIKDGGIYAYHLSGAGVNLRNTVRPGTWPQGAVPNFRLESQSLKSEVTIGAWRAPITNFLGFAEQAFIDELAELAGKDPLDFRLESLQQAVDAPSGKMIYEPLRMIGVLKLLAEKSDWYRKTPGVFKGVSCYYSHNSYAAQVAEITLKNGQPSIKRFVVVTDCGIVVNRSGAMNQAMAGVVDGIGHAMYGDMILSNGIPQFDNFNKYRLIRNSESPKVEAYFVDSKENPTGLGEPNLPPAAAALASAIYAATGKRLYSQPFSKQGISLA